MGNSNLNTHSKCMFPLWMMEMNVSFRELVPDDIKGLMDEEFRDLNKLHQRPPTLR